VTAANAQAAIAKSQLCANLRSADMAMRPILRIKVDSRQLDPYLTRVTGQTSEKWRLSCNVTNVGLGPALEIESYYGNDPSNAAGWFLESLGVGEHRTVNFVGEGHVLMIRYKSTHGSIFVTQIQRYPPPNDEETFQFHKLIKDAYAGKDAAP
jgi:hypothetical protein